MHAATRRNLVLVAVGLVLLFVLWQVPGRRAESSLVRPGSLTPQPTPTVASQWRPIAETKGQGSRDLCREGHEVTVPGPWRIRATPTDRTVRVTVIDRRDGRIFARVWAAGADFYSLATLPQGNGTFCLQVEATEGYTLLVEAWEAPLR